MQQNAFLITKDFTDNEGAEKIIIYSNYDNFYCPQLTVN